MSDNQRSVTPAMKAAELVRVMSTLMDQTREKEVIDSLHELATRCNENLSIMGEQYNKEKGEPPYAAMQEQLDLQTLSILCAALCIAWNRMVGCMEKTSIIKSYEMLQSRMNSGGSGMVFAHEKMSQTMDMLLKSAHDNSYTCVCSDCWPERKKYEEALKPYRGSANPN